jgi:hypothetical protein
MASSRLHVDVEDDEYALDEYDDEWEGQSGLTSDEGTQEKSAASPSDDGNSDVCADARDESLDSSQFDKMGMTRANRRNKPSELERARLGAVDAGVSEELEGLNLIHSITQQAAQSFPRDMEKIAKDLFVSGGHAQSENVDDGSSARARANTDFISHVAGFLFSHTSPAHSASAPVAATVPPLPPLWARRASASFTMQPTGAAISQLELKSRIRRPRNSGSGRIAPLTASEELTQTKKKMMFGAWYEDKEKFDIELNRIHQHKIVKPIRWRGTR